MSMQIPIGGGQTTTLRDMIGLIAGQGKQLVVDLDIDLVTGGLSRRETFVLVQFNGHAQ